MHDWQRRWAVRLPPNAAVLQPKALAETLALDAAAAARLARGGGGGGGGGGGDARVARAEFGLPPDASDGELVNNWPYMHARFCLPLLHSLNPASLTLHARSSLLAFAFTVSI